MDIMRLREHFSALEITKIEFKDRLDLDDNFIALLNRLVGNNRFKLTNSKENVTLGHLIHDNPEWERCFFFFHELLEYFSPLDDLKKRHWISPDARVLGDN